MANYGTITISDTLPASGEVRVAYSANSSWTTHGRLVDVGLIPPNDHSYTQYKLWGYGSYPDEGSTTWSGLPTGTLSILLDDEATVQTLSARFYDGSNTSSVVTASGISYDFDIPSKSANLSWIGLTDENTTSAILRNTTDNIDLTFSKAQLEDMKFHDRNFGGVTIVNNIITVASGSQIWKIIENDDDAYVPVKKTFTTSDTPMVRVDTGSGYVPLTTFSGEARSDVSGDYAGRITGYDWDAGTKELNFNIHRFSSYGFATINEVTFTASTPAAGYNGTQINVYVGVYDTTGEGVEGAPVTISGVSGDIGDFSANPVNTNVNGIATFTLTLDTLGSATFDAEVDGVHTDPDKTIWCYATPPAARSMLEQNTQVAGTLDYLDTVSGTNTAAVAEPSSVLNTVADDLNVMRTLMKQITGTTDWFSDLGAYFDPTSTTSGSDATKDLNLSNIAGNTLDSQTIIVAVETDNSGVGYSISTSDEGFLYTTSLAYATQTDRRGLPIYESTTNSGSYYDEGGSDDVCVIDLIDLSTGVEFSNTSDQLIYAKFHDGADATGSGVGTDVYVKFYANDAPYTWTASDPSEIMMIFPYRKVMSTMEEYEWTRTDFVNSFEGDEELIDDIVNLWDFTGATDGETSPVFTYVSGTWALGSDPADLEAAVDALNTEIGDRTYTTTTSGSYLTDDEEIVASLDALSEGVISNDTEISSNTSAIGSNSTAISTLQTNMTTLQTDISDLESAVGTTGDASTLDYSSSVFVSDGTSIETAIGALDAAVGSAGAAKYVEETAGITAGVEHAIPGGHSYTPVSTSGIEGNNMDVWLEGMLLAADTGANGANADRDYGETSASGITFRFDVDAGSNITYIIHA